MECIIDDRAQFIEPRKLVKWLEMQKDADPELYAGYIDALCTASGWSVPSLLKLTNTRVPQYAWCADGSKWNRVVAVI